MADSIPKHSCQTACFWTAFAVTAAMFGLEWRQSDAWIAHNREQLAAYNRLLREYQELDAETRRLRVELSIHAEDPECMKHCKSNSIGAP